jgi:hypothetical protein
MLVALAIADASSSTIIKIPPNYGHGVSGAEIKVKIIKILLTSHLFQLKQEYLQKSHCR